MNPGLLYGALAFAIWGLFPLYFRQVAAVAPLEVVLHRAAWSLAFIALIVVPRRRWAWLGNVLRQPRQLVVFCFSALLLGINAYVYVYAVNSGRVVEASLGYFINPLVNVLLGVVVLHERLNRAQRIAVALATAGVLWLTVLAGHPPWISLALAFSFGGYGLLRKMAPLGPLEGLALETLLLAPLVLPLLWWFGVHQGGALSRGDPTELAWLVFAGPMTVVPLLLFAASARRLPLATVGLLQYLGPTIQLAIGIWLFGEPFGPGRLVGFTLIWASLALYSADGLLRTRRVTPAATQAG
jgi:chloramphenicol-sensitive protein RarD